jgi:PTS system fructose-specific IIC component
MRISDLLLESTTLLDMKAHTQTDVINELANLLYQRQFVRDLQQFKEDIWKREREAPTSIGEGIAIPHAMTNAVKTPAIAFGRSLTGIEYGNERCHLFFMIAASKNATNEHLQTLSRLSTFLMDESFRAKLLVAQTSADVHEAILQKEEETNDCASSSANSVWKNKRIVAVTACPTGIAHTFMAAESLKEQAERLGVTIKVQTNGSTGIGNALSAEDIEQADAVIVAADTRVELEPFIGKRLIHASVKKGIHQAEDLIIAALNDPNVKPYKPQKLQLIKETKLEKPSYFYKHVMNGVSFMIPFVVAGGILIAISFFFGINAANPDSPEYNAFAAFLSTVGGEAAFSLMVPIFAGYIAYSIADRPGLAPGAIGGMLATLGGSGFLGGLAAGFVAGYTILLLKNAFDRILYKSLQSLVPVLFLPVLGVFLTGLIMHYIVNGPLSWLNNFLIDWLGSLGGTNALLLGALLASMMAFDMGGPINKTASAFGLAMFSNGVFEPSAALMVGGMVPPLGIALATSLFKNRFTNEERDAGKAAYVMGACFITEGAIPFAAADPLRVIPANVIGSAIGGALCMYLNISLQAPHGGIFVIPIAASSPWLYVFCILLGSLITCMLIGILKKPHDRLKSKH